MFSTFLCLQKWWFPSWLISLLLQISLFFFLSRKWNAAAAKKWAKKLLNKNKRNWQKARKQNEGGDDKKLQWVMGNEAYHLWKEKLPIRRLRVGNTHDRVESWSERREKKNHSDLRVKRREEKTYHSLLTGRDAFTLATSCPPNHIPSPSRNRRTRKRFERMPMPMFFASCSYVRCWIR